MHRRRLFGLGSVLALIGAGLAVAPEGGGALTIDSVDDTGYPSVEIVVSAEPGLDFTTDPSVSLTLTENGEPRPVEASRVPVDGLQVMLVIDTSASMSGEPIEAARSAAIGFVDAMPAEVPIGLASCGDVAELLLAPTADHDAVRGAIAGLEAEGETSIYDAVVLASGAFSADRPDRAMVLLSDGGDTVSSATLEDAALASTGVRLHVFALDTGDANRVALEQLAGSPDAVASAADPEALDALYRNAAGAIANRYVIVYESSASGPTEITIRLATPAGELSITESIVLGPTAVPTTIPATTRPVTTSATTIAAPVTTTPEIVAPTSPPSTTTEPVFAVEPASGSPRATSSVLFWLGVALAFVALVTTGLAVAPADPTRRRGRRQLGLRPSTTDQPAGLKERLTRLAALALERTGQRGRIDQALEAAGYNVRAAELVAITAIGALLVGGFGQLVAGPLLAVLMFAVVPVVVALIVQSAAERRRRAFVDGLPEVLQLMVGALRSGYGLMQAVDAVSQQAPEPARSEFQRVMFETRFGRDPGEALQAMATRMRSHDAAWLVTAIEINRDVGGDLAQTMDTVADTIRERQRLSRQIQALTAEGRISAYILAVLPFALGALLAVINPDYFEPLTRGVGLVLVAIAVVLVVVGVAWMQRIVKSVGGAP